MRSEVREFDPWYFFIVQLYGCDLNSPLRPFLEFVATRTNQEGPGTIVLCGGPTQQEKFPGKTEAGVAEGFLREHAACTESILPSLILEDRSFTTEDNVRNACAYIRNVPSISQNWHRVRVRAFCETHRSLKSSGFYWDLLPEVRRHHGRVWMETQSWELAHPDLELAKANAAFVSRRFPVVGRALSGIRRLHARFR